MTKKILLGLTAFMLLSSLTLVSNNSNASVGASLYGGMTFVEVQARGPNTGGGHVQGEQFRIDLTVIFEVATDRVVAILYTNTGAATTGGSFERLWIGTRVYNRNRLLPNHVTGYPDLITAYIGRTAGELSQTSTSTANRGADKVATITGATQTASNFVSSIQIAAQEYLQGNAVRSAWRPN